MLDAGAGIPPLYLVPATGPTLAQTVSGEIWLNSSANTLEYNSGGSRIVLHNATGSTPGLIQLAGDLGTGGTHTAPQVIGLHFGTGTQVLAITAATEDLTAVANKGQSLCVGSNSTMGWSSAPITIATAVRRTYFRASCDIVGTTAMRTDGPTNYANITTTPTRTNDLKGFFLSYSAAAGTAQGCRGDSGYGLVSMQHNPTFYAYIKTGASLTQRIHVGLMTTLQGNTDALSGTGISLLFVSGGGSIVGRSHDGTNESATATLGTWNTNTYYLVKIRVSGTNIYYSINGGAETQKTNNLPPSTTTMGWEFKVFSTSGTTGSLISWIHCEYGA